MGYRLRVFLDTSIFLYAVGSEHRYRGPCRRILAATASDEIDAVVNVEVLQEYVHVRTRKGIERSVAARESTDIISVCLVEDVTMANFQVALRMFGATPEIELRDAIHTATAFSQLVDGIVSPDRGFDAVPELTRFDPVEFVSESRV